MLRRHNLPPLCLSSLYLGALLALTACDATRPSPATKPPAARHAPAASAQIPRAALLEDVDELARLLTSTHPEPYLRGGGRVAFYDRLTQLRGSIPTTGLTREAFLRRVAPLVASLGDGHTKIQLPRAERASPRPWIDLDLAGATIYVRRVYAPDARGLLGRALVAVEGIPLARLIARMRELRGADNRVQTLVQLMNAFERGRWLARLLARPALPAKLTLSLRDPTSGAVRDLRVAVTRKAPNPGIAAKTSLTLPPANAAGLSWSMLGEGEGGSDNRAALLRIGSMMRYREAFEVWQHAGFNANLHAHLDRVAAAAVGRARAAKLRDVAAKIAVIPAATQVYRALGYCARLIRLQGRGAHVLTEVYAPALRKWILVDGQFAAHVTKGDARGGVSPLSALEVVQALRARKDPRKPAAGLKAWVGGRLEPRYLAWLGAYTKLVMAPVDMSYGHELDRLAVLLPASAIPPATKPSYLRRASYLFVRAPKTLYPSCPSALK